MLGYKPVDFVVDEEYLFDARVVLLVVEASQLFYARPQVLEVLANQLAVLLLWRQGAEFGEVQEQVFLVLAHKIVLEAILGIDVEPIPLEQGARLDNPINLIDLGLELGKRLATDIRTFPQHLTFLDEGHTDNLLGVVDEDELLEDQGETLLFGLDEGVAAVQGPG